MFDSVSKKGCPNKELINKIIANKIAEYNKQALEFKAEQKEFTAASLIESKQAIQTTIKNNT